MWNVPHPRKIIKHAVNANSFCMCALQIGVTMPNRPPPPSPPYPAPTPSRHPNAYPKYKPVGIPRKPVFSQLLPGFNMRNLGNIVGGEGGRLLLLLLLLLLHHHLPLLHVLPPHAVLLTHLLQWNMDLNLLLVQSNLLSLVFSPQRPRPQ